MLTLEETIDVWNQVCKHEEEAMHHRRANSASLYVKLWVLPELWPFVRFVWPVLID